MDDEDDLVPQPDEKGAINLSNRAWVNLDPHLWTLSDRIVKLDLSYNHITEIPSQIGEMIMLRELVASFNKIVRIPKEIGTLKRLKKLYLNSNRLKKLPEEVGLLEMLEELIVSENSLEMLPSNVSKMANLRILKVSNNKLKKIPYDLAELLTLEVIDCANNPELSAVPLKWQGDTDSVLFTCRLHRDYSVQLEEVTKSNNELSKHSQFMEQENLIMKERVMNLQTEIDEIRLNIPKNIALKLEKAKQLAEDQELMDDKEKRQKGANGGGCNIS
mmetsp:Transcript_15957/g.21985  ORF Transcript_15957/g.21985 Transcript_15957/m.21985 type:complete len:274 (-) Transcript_15957:1816-2637(-)